MTKSNLTKKDFPADTFRFYNDKNLDKNGVEAGKFERRFILEKLQGNIFETEKFLIFVFRRKQ